MKDAVIAAIMTLVVAGSASGAGRYLEVEYPASDKPGELQLGVTAVPSASYKGAANEAIWLPNERVAKVWMEYVKTGRVDDDTPPPAPINVKASAKGEEGIEITWDVDADFESGLQGFVIQRDGKELARLPEKPVGRFGRPLFQTMSYHDTPEKPLPSLRFLDRTARPGEKHHYAVLAINGLGLKSEPSRAATRDGG